MCKNIIILVIIIIILILLYRLNKFVNYEYYEYFETSREHKIAFLFLTYNNLKRPDIWNKFFDIDENSSSKYSNKFSIYNHAKEQDKVTDSLLVNRHISENVDTCWGCFGTVEANILLMKSALQDPLNKKFILVSESCTPIISFDRLYKELMKDNKNRINFWKTNNTMDRYDSIIDPEFFKSDFKKHCAQGLIFNRAYAELLVNTLNENKKKWKNMNCVDEHYFGNLLRVLDSNFNENTDYNNVTFDMWQTDKLNYNNNNIDNNNNNIDNNNIDNINNDDIKSDHYINLKKISNKAIDRLREHNFIFARKIDKETEIDVNYILA